MEHGEDLSSKNRGAKEHATVVGREKKIRLSLKCQEVSNLKREKKIREFLLRPKTRRFWQIVKAVKMLNAEGKEITTENLAPIFKISIGHASDWLTRLEWAGIIKLKERRKGGKRVFELVKNQT